ncbi:ribosomal-processing cysteine protease Prp [Paenibacillus campi]|uniref:ribosomal-processing cysteine protease Prp n=1 Tax=Paenibacillus campi TaxID=3106031 RepID=UPI002AFFC585|nr:ribosomal-processing cysteine protease Prp [Paenibacillus sp. SGZ-1014]
MIIVRMERLEDGTIHGFSSRGHAGYADSGEDIVCAAVSAITVGTVNSIEVLAGIEMKARMKDGFLSAYLPELPENTAQDKIQLLLESMQVMLESIEESYGQYIQIKQVTITEKRR